MTCIKKVTALTVLLALFLFSVQPLWVAEAYDNLYSFSPEVGGGPRGSLIYVDSQSLLYGMTRGGGSKANGTLFSYDPVSFAYTSLHDFDATIDGATPEGDLVYVEGVLYGMTSLGGPGDGLGTVFAYTIATDSLVVLHTFGLNPGDPFSPTGSLLYDQETGLLYGMTVKGGTNNDGVIFSYDIDTSTFTKLFDFGGAVGARPRGTLTYYENAFYGTTFLGGDNNAGVFFRFIPDDAEPYAVIHHFGVSEQDGENPAGSVVFDENGTLYGMTSGDISDKAIIFSYSTTDGYRIVHTFDNGGRGRKPYGSLLYKGFGKLYGMTSGGGSGGVGVIFLYDLLTDTYTVEYDFDSTNGAQPYGSLTALGDGMLYGMTSAGGLANEGVLFQIASRDTDPDPFSFTLVEGVSADIDVVSDQISVTGINASVPVTITDCNSVLCSVNTPRAEDGEKIALTITSGACGTTSSATLQIGTESATFTVSTESCGGGGGGDPDTEAPTVSFSMPSSGTSLNVSVTFDALDNSGVTGYMLTESATPPEASDDRWQGSAPTSYTFSTYGSYTLYAWAKDAADNVSAETSQAITLTDPTPPDPDPEPEPEPEPEPDPDDEDTGGGGGGRNSSGSSVAGAGLVGVQPPTPTTPVVVEVPTQTPAPVAVVAPRPRIEPAIVLDSPIKQAIQRNFTPAQVEIIEVSIKAIIATVTAIGGAIVLASVLFLNPLARPEFVLIPIRLWNLLLILLGLRKKPVPWGTVYDSITKQPVDPVRVSLIDIEGKVVETSITDSSGRYGFAAAPGVYKVVLSKTNYLFPSHVIAQENDMRDELYEKPYFGDYLPYDPQVPIIKNIPIDPIDFDTAAFAKKNGDLSFRYSKREVVAERLFNTIFFTTFAIVVASLFIYPEKYSVIVLALYVAAFILRRHNKRMKHTGRIYDMYGKPLAHVIIKVYSAVDNTLIKTIKTTRQGRYYAHLPKGLYTIRVERKTTDGLYVPVYSSPELLVQHGILNKVFNIAYS